VRPEVFLQDGLLLRTREGSTHLIVAVSLRHRLFEITHSGPTAGHLGADRTFKQLRDSFFWPGMRRDIAHWHIQCPQCAMSKGSPLRPHGKHCWTWYNRHSVWTTHRFEWVEIPTGCSGRFHKVGRGLSPTRPRSALMHDSPLQRFFR